MNRLPPAPLAGARKPVPLPGLFGAFDVSRGTTAVNAEPEHIHE